MPWRRKWQPTPVFLLGKSHGQRSLAGYSPWGRKESDKTEQHHLRKKAIEHLVDIIEPILIVVFFIDQGLVDQSQWKERGKRRERESSISRVTWKTNKVHIQDLYCSRRHGASSQGGLENPGKKVSLAGFHAPKRMKTERRTRGTQVSSGARVFY